MIIISKIVIFEEFEIQKRGIIVLNILLVESDGESKTCFSRINKSSI